METSLILAKILGLYLGIICLAMIFNPIGFRQMINEFLESPASRTMGALIALILGIIMIVFHNVWVMDWPVLITMLAWLTFLKGLIRLFFPGYLSRAIYLIENNAFYYGSAVLYLILAAVLIYYGFIAS